MASYDPISIAQLNKPAKRYFLPRHRSFVPRNAAGSVCAFTLEALRL
jgi:hypothetical protein